MSTIFYCLLCRFAQLTGVVVFCCCKHNGNRLAIAKSVVLFQRLKLVDGLELGDDDNGVLCILKFQIHTVIMFTVRALLVHTNNSLTEKKDKTLSYC